MPLKPKNPRAEHPILGRIHDKHIKFMSLDILNLEWPEDPSQFIALLRDRMSGCQECLLAKTRNSVALADGEHDAEIMIILESPGFMEDLAALPLVGSMELRGSHCGTCSRHVDCYSKRILSNPHEKSYARRKRVDCRPKPTDTNFLDKQFWLRTSGSLVDGILVKSFGMAFPRANWVTQYNKKHPDSPLANPETGELVRSPWYFTNAVNCRPFDELSFKDIPPPTVSIRACLSWLLLQHAAVQPKVVIALGAISKNVVMGSQKAGMSARKNTVYDTLFGPAITNIHPASIMRDQSPKRQAMLYMQLRRTFEMALEMAGLVDLSDPFG